MKSINKLFLLFAILAAAACEKAPGLIVYKEGSPVTLASNVTSVSPTVADSNKAVITLTWTSPAYATDSNTYKYVVELDSSTRNFTKPNVLVRTGARTISFTGRQLNAMLLSYGFTLGVPVDLDFRVTSSYANNNEQYKSNIIKIRVSPFSDPAILSTQKTTVTGSLANAGDPQNKFSWTKAFKEYTGNVTYSLQYDSAGKNFASLSEIPAGSQIFEKTLTVAEMNETALNEGVAGGAQGRIEYRIKAVTAQGAISYSNTVSVLINTYLPILRFYLPGSYQAATGNGSNWDPPTAPELIRDIRPGALNRIYYIYIWLPAGAEFKVTQGRSWDINYGGSGGTLVQNSSNNLSVATSGVYRISIDRTALNYDIRVGQMGFVGDATGANWDPPSTFPNFAMGAPATNLFVGLTNLTTAGWKLIDNNQWNNGDINVSNTRSYGSTGASGSSMVINADNFPSVSATGRYRVIWDGRNRDNILYEQSLANEMRVVGNGIQGVPDWNPGASPQMTYFGNGIWQTALTLVANREIKFVAGNDWGVFDYEDNGPGASAGTRKLKWDGGANFATPSTTGSYTITLNEYTQTVTIN
ncbi:MAG: SusE domain-containing protein [Chitinophagaceae bacterium]|nr:SusE domain-containing protein [Chitinophagaceae bacterium]